MNLENQVVSLELAKKLKKLGVKQESIWYWAVVNVNGNKKLSLLLGQSKLGIVDYKYSAFTVAELGEMLADISDKMCDKGEYVFFGSEKVGAYWECGSEKMLDHTFEDKIEANARAKMLIYLLESNLLKI